MAHGSVYNNIFDVVVVVVVVVMMVMMINFLFLHIFLSFVNRSKNMAAAIIYCVRLMAIGLNLLCTFPHS